MPWPAYSPFGALWVARLVFPAGQAIQASNAWYPEFYQGLPTHGLTQYFNWWNMMETTFGFVFGAVMGFGVWLHRHRVDENQTRPPEDEGQESFLSPLLECILALVYVRLLIAWNFQSVGWVDAVADQALPVIIVPTIAVLRGRVWPYLVCLPITMLPIAGKTIRQLVFGEQVISAELGWDLYMALPLAITTAAAIGFAATERRHRVAGHFLALGLLITAWLYFGLNFAFFHFPWPWQEWTGRTPNGLLFMVSLMCLTLLAIYTIYAGRMQGEDDETSHYEA